MMTKLDRVLGLRFFGYFFCLYVTFVVLYVGIDCCQKYGKVLYGFKAYSWAHLLFVMLDRSVWAVGAASFLWVRSIVVSSEWQLHLICGIPFWYRIRAVFLSLFLVGLLFSAVLVRYQENVWYQRNRARNALVFEKEEERVSWIKDHTTFYRFVNGVCDRVVMYTAEASEAKIEVFDGFVDVSQQARGTSLIVKTFAFQMIELFVLPLLVVVFFWFSVLYELVLWYSGLGFYLIYFGGCLFECNNFFWQFFWVCLLLFFIGIISQKERSM